MNNLGIYCHIPFCVKKCAYCDFPSFVPGCRGDIRTYFQALHKEIKGFRDENEGSIRPFSDTIYFGGGTPSAVPPEYIEETLSLLHEVFLISKSAEQTIEINPGTLTLEKAEIYAAAGFNRVSMGLQAWQDVLLKSLGRIHHQCDFIESMEFLKRAGFKNISVDVMYGLPGQKLGDVIETLEALMTFAPTHLSCYSLILEEGTPMKKREEQGKITVPGDDAEREMHWAIDGFLRNQGYEHYEISSYAKPGFKSRHNLKYWEETPYLGFGLGAHGFINDTRYGNPGSFAKYYEAIDLGKSPGIYDLSLTKDEMMKEWMLLGLRKLNGIDDVVFKRRFGESFFGMYQNSIEHLIETGLLVRDGSVLRLTDHGQDFGNQVFMEFL